MPKQVTKNIFISLILLLVSPFLLAQCPQLNDFFGNPSNNPYWYDCDGGTFTLNINSPDNIGPWTVDWGDGSPTENGPSLTVGNSISHVYGATIDTFNVTFTETSSGCVINGVVVMEEPTNASIQIPFGGVTQTCAPGDLEFTNSSTDVSPTTVFQWDFGDGSGIQTFDYTNAGQTVTHTYQQGTVNCVTQVTLTAENYCNTIQGGNSTATFDPIRIWDIDDAAIDASDVLLCYPDTTVTFQNNTDRNCFMQGNIAQRYEWWNFGDYWGNGYDSIVGWVAWPPALPYTMEYPGIGTYDVMLVDSSFCGLDTANITIQIVPPPFAALNASEDTICEGESITFGNLSGGGANAYFWNFGDGTGWNPSAGGNVTHTYNNSGDYTVQVVANINGGTAACTDTATLDIHVLPSPVANYTFDNNNGCDSMYVNFGDNSSPDATMWQWDFDNGQTDNTNAPPIQFYGAPGNYDVELTVTNANNCSNTTNQTFTVYESPLPAFTPSSVCVNDIANFVDNSTSAAGDPIINWLWDFGDGSPTSNNQNPSHTYTASGFYDVIFTVSTAFCSTTDTVQINVENVPTAAYNVDTTEGCADLLVNFTNNSSINATNFYWDFGDGDTSNLASPSHLFLNSFGVDTTYDVTFIAETTFGCADTLYEQVSVYPNPDASFTDNATLDCAPLVVDFTNTSTGGVSFEWDFGDGSPIDTNTNVSHTYQNLTQFINNHTVLLEVTSANGCTDTISKNIVVYPEPQFGFSVNPDSGCSPLVVTFPSVIGAVDYQWDFGDGNTGTGPTPNHVYYNNSTNNVIYPVTLTATSPFGCVDTTYGQVLVFPNPDAQFTIDSLNGCHPFVVSLTNNSTGGINYHWDMGDGTQFDTLSSNFQYTFSNTTGSLQQMDIQLIAETDRGCMDTLVESVDVYPAVTAVMQVDTFGCSPFNTDFNSFSIGAATHYWDFGDGSPIDTTTNPSHIFVNPTAADMTFTVSLIIESIYGCRDTVYQDIVVFPETDAFIAVDDSIGCHPLVVEFTNNSVGAVNYYWDFADGTNSDTTALIFNHTFNNVSGTTQSYQVELISETNRGCRDTTNQIITVYPDVVAVLQADTFGCSPFTTTFSNFSSGAISYTWDFGDNTGQNNQASPTHQFVNPTTVDVTYTVTLIAESVEGCHDTTYQDILVYPPTIAQINVDTFVGCHPLMVEFSNNSINGNNYYWDFNDGTTLDTLALQFSHTFYNNSGVTQNFQVQLISETDKGCRDTTYQGVDVYPDIQAIFIADTAGCSPLNNTFVNNSIGALSYQWDFGDGSPIDNIPNPSHVYTNTTPNDLTYTATLIAESVFGCRDTTQSTVTVYATPVASFTATPVVQTFPNTAVALGNTTSIGNWDYVWSYGGGDTSYLSIPPNHTYPTWGDYTIYVEVSGTHCSDTASQLIQIIPPVPVASFTGSGSGCRPVQVQFVNNSIYASSYTWNFGDGGFSSQEHPSYTYYNPGIYTVTLTANGDGGQDVYTQTQIVEVYEIPTAFFTVNPSQVFLPSEPILAYNLSNFAATYEWDFGDGNTSTEVSPQHTYSEVGFYDIQLIATSINNCKDTFSIENAVEVKVKGEIQIPNAFTPSASGGNGGMFDKDSDDNDVFHPIIVGAKQYELNIFNKWGELLFISKDVNIGWDGYYRGELSKQDVYVYKIKVTYLDDRTETFVGDVTLLR